MPPDVETRNDRRAPRAVLITGATGALGTALTGRFVEEGHKVMAARAEAPGSKEGSGRPQDGLAYVEADVTDPHSVAELVDRTVAQLGRIDVLTHLVGGWTGGRRLEDHDVEMWDRAFELNLRSAFLCSRAVLPIMRAQGWGRIVFVSSRAARGPRNLEGAYATAKAGVSVLAEIIAEENRDVDVTANVVAPSFLDTAANRAAGLGAAPGSLVPVADVARVIAFLSTPEAWQLRGAWLPVFGRS